jgi:hypothetical protein
MKVQKSILKLLLMMSFCFARVFVQKNTLVQKKKKKKKIKICEKMRENTNNMKECREKNQDSRAVVQL